MIHPSGRPRWRNRPFHPSLGKVALAFGLAATAACQAREAWGGPEGENRRIVVIPFHADSAKRSPQGQAVAESLAVRLNGVQGLKARVAPAGETAEADFTVRGEVVTRDGRLVVATRLHENDRDEVLWTATFWRKDSVDSDLVSDLAAALAEAIYGQLARKAVTTTRGKL